MKNFTIGLILGILVVFGYQQLNYNPSVNSSEAIVIGGIAPLTGDAASLGIQTQEISNMRVEEVNKEGGINGRNLEIIWEDGKCTPGEASRAAQKLIGIDKVSVILGGVCSGETLGATPITERNKVILFSPISTSPEVTHAGDFVFRSAPSDSTQGMVLADYANKHFKRVGLISENTDYALGVANVFEEIFEGEIVREDYLSTESDFKTRITKLKNEKLDALIINPQSPPKYEIILKQLQEQNWKTPFLVNEVAAGNAESSIKFKDFLVKNKTVGANFIVPESDELNDVLQKYEAKHGKKVEYLNYTGTSYDGINILIHALSQVENISDTESIRDELYAIKDFPGLLGKVSMDENGDVNITYTLFEFNGEEFIPISE
ncbi:ABC transporter substrate-binding protein [Candidatus Gracilibacteria bacterium]|nr:ABC transporter substrate-binding protein [Candidatus Gracilibacteria bacterium]